MAATQEARITSDTAPRPLVLMGGSAAPLLWFALCVAIFSLLSGYLDLGGKYWLASLKTLPTERFYDSPRVVGSMLIWGASELCLFVAVAWNLVVAISILLEDLTHASVILRRSVLIVLPIVWLLEECCMLYPGVDVAGGAAQNLLGAVYLVSPSVDWLVTVGNTLAAITVTTIAAACCVLACAGVKVEDDTMARVVDAFSLLLYSASVLLLIGLLEIFSLFEWAAVLRSLSGEKTSTYTLASSVALGAGMVGSLLLALLFVPVALAVQERIGELTANAARREEQHAAENKATPPRRFDPAEWLRSHGVAALPLSLVRSYAAMLLPLAGGLVPAIAKHVS